MPVLQRKKVSIIEWRTYIKERKAKRNDHYPKRISNTKKRKEGSRKVK